MSPKITLLKVPFRRETLVDDRVIQKKLADTKYDMEYWDSRGLLVMEDNVPFTAPVAVTGSSHKGYNLLRLDTNTIYQTYKTEFYVMMQEFGVKPGYHPIIEGTFYVKKRGDSFQLASFC